MTCFDGCATGLPSLLTRRRRDVRVFVTGASGLLGREVLKELRGGPWEVRGLYASRQCPHLVKCDLTVEAEVMAQIREFRPRVVMHLAAERRPDVVDKDVTRALKLNIVATRTLARTCHQYGAWFIFVSTDYVFDGSWPPYTVNDAPNPLSAYGRQKLEGEQILLQESPEAAVLRVPLLYGPMEYPKESSVTALYDSLLHGLTKADHGQKRYPTFTCGAAKVLRKMEEAHCRGKNLKGVYHWQADECLTKYDMVRVIADIAIPPT